MAQMWQSQSKEVHRDWLDSVVLESLDRLNDWETTFIEDIEHKLDMGIPLTQGQEEKLEQIYTKYTS